MTFFTPLFKPFWSAGFKPVYVFVVPSNWVGAAHLKKLFVTSLIWSWNICVPWAWGHPRKWQEQVPTAYWAPVLLRQSHTIILCTLHTPHFTLHTSHFTLHTSHFTLHTSHFKLHTAHYTLHTAHATLHSAHSTYHIPHSTQQIAHRNVHTVQAHCTIHTKYSLLNNRKW